MSESEKSSDETAEKVSSEDHARTSTSAFLVSGALCCIIIVLLCVLLFWTSSSSPAAVVGAEEKKVVPDATMPGGPTTTVLTQTTPREFTRHTHTTTAAKTKAGPGKTTLARSTQLGHASTAAKAKPGSENETAEGSTQLGHASTKAKAKPGSENETAEATTTTTTPPPRPTPPYTLTCTLGPYMTESTVFPEDGLCSYIILDWLPATKAADLAGPFGANVTRFLTVSASYRGTEFGIAFDSRSVDKMKELLKDTTAKTHLDVLYDKRIWHFGYINTDNYALNDTFMKELLLVLTKIKNLMKDKSTSDHQAGTILAAAWRERVNKVSVEQLEGLFSFTGNPDLFISKAHLSDLDMTFEECLILPSTFLVKPVPDSEGGSIYEYSLLTAFEYASDVEKRIPKLTGPVSVAVSVGLQGRWYFMPKNQTGDTELGQPCGPAEMRAVDRPFDSAATACLSSDVQKNEPFNCKYIVNNTVGKVFTFDDVETLRYKLCTGKKNATSLKMGIMAAGLEFADPVGRCAEGRTTFPLLRALRNMVMFFKDHYASEKDFEKCLTQGAALPRSRSRASRGRFAR